MNKPILKTEEVLCDAPGCRKPARHEHYILDDEGEDQGREMLCNAHYNF